MRTIIAILGVIIIGAATAFGVDLPKDEIAGTVTVLIEAVAGVLAVLWAASSDKFK